VKKVFVALSAILVWTAIPAVSANAVSIGQTCAKTTLGTRVSIRVSKKPVIVVCRNIAGRKKWIRAAVQTLVTTTTSTTTLPPKPIVSFTDVVDSVDPTLHTITVESMQPRTYLLNLPIGYDSTKPIPLVLGFHSRTTNANEFLSSTQILMFSTDMQFITVAINGSLHDNATSWNAGNCCAYATDYNENDFLLTSTVIESIKNQFSIDDSRIWAIGHSNGGMMSYHLACDMSDKITAVAIVGGALMDDSCDPIKPVSIIHIHGDLDPTIPFTGGGKFDVPNIPASVIRPNTKFSCNIASNEIAPLAQVDQTVWSCEHETQTKLMNYLDNGHEWHLEYTKEILRFLFAHPRK